MDGNSPSHNRFIQQLIKECAKISNEEEEKIWNDPNANDDDDVAIQDKYTTLLCQNILDAAQRYQQRLERGITGSENAKSGGNNLGTTNLATKVTKSVTMIKSTHEITNEWSNFESNMDVENRALRESQRSNLRVDGVYGGNSTTNLHPASSRNSNLKQGSGVKPGSSKMNMLSGSDESNEAFGNENVPKNRSQIAVGPEAGGKSPDGHTFRNMAQPDDVRLKSKVSRTEVKRAVVLSQKSSMNNAGQIKYEERVNFNEEVNSEVIENQFSSDYLQYMVEDFARSLYDELTLLSMRIVAPKVEEIRYAKENALPEIRADRNVLLHKCIFKSHDGRKLSTYDDYKENGEKTLEQLAQLLYVQISEYASQLADHAVEYVKNVSPYIEDVNAAEKDGSLQNSVVQNKSYRVPQNEKETKKFYKNLSETQKMELKSSSSDFCRVIVGDVMYKCYREYNARLERMRDVPTDLPAFLMVKASEENIKIRKCLSELRNAMRLNGGLNSSPNKLTQKSSKISRSKSKISHSRVEEDRVSGRKIIEETTEYIRQSAEEYYEEFGGYEGILDRAYRFRYEIALTAGAVYALFKLNQLYKSLGRWWSPKGVKKFR